MCQRKECLRPHYSTPNALTATKRDTWLEIVQSPRRRVLHVHDDQEGSNQGFDPWICSVATSDHAPDGGTDSGRVPRRGPTFKVKVEIEGVRTRALLDHGAQVTIVRRQLLSHIRE